MYHRRSHVSSMRFRPGCCYDQDSLHRCQQVGLREDVHGFLVHFSHPGSTFCHFCLRPFANLHPENHESDFVDFFSGSGSSGHSIYEIGRKMPSDGFSLWSGSLASDWCLRYPHPLAVGRATRSTYTPSVPMSLQVLVADFAVAKKSLKGNFHFPFGGQPTWTNSCWNSVFGGFFHFFERKMW